ncbi:MAG TPA: DUF1028 domain-containing protein [Candidatus Deferrimicrobium sp.]|nr:DUF1028 domain-containing protein [Candidatus Deferrimicrobium sp.]
MHKKIHVIIFGLLIFAGCFLYLQPLRGEEVKKNDAHFNVNTFSIVARDEVTGELGVAVASRFFAVGHVVPWAKAGVGAVATQSFMNTSFGWRGLELLEKGLTPGETVNVLIRNDENPAQRQLGIVAADGKSATYTGKSCLAWAGGRNGPNYAIQGNILAGEAVVTAMEKAFLETKGTLAERMYAALVAGDNNGGDSRGKQSAVLLVVKEGAGYGGYTDRAIDIRVDDHPEPFKELGRLLDFGQMNYAWNEAWTYFTKKKFVEALPRMEAAANMPPANAEVFYDLAVIRLAAGKQEAALAALEKALALNGKLKKQAQTDGDLSALHGNPTFERLLKSL